MKLEPLFANSVKQRLKVDSSYLWGKWKNVLGKEGPRKGGTYFWESASPLAKCENY